MTNEQREVLLTYLDYHQADEVRVTEDLIADFMRVLEDANLDRLTPIQLTHTDVPVVEIRAGVIVECVRWPL